MKGTRFGTRLKLLNKTVGGLVNAGRSGIEAWTRREKHINGNISKTDKKTSRDWKVRWPESITEALVT